MKLIIEVSSRDEESIKEALRILDRMLPPVTESAIATDAVVTPTAEPPAPVVVLESEAPSAATEIIKEYVAPPDTQHVEVPAPPVADAELDADGYPWDERIHASTRTRLARGNTWKLKRGIDPKLVESVRAETRPAEQAAPPVSPAPAAAVPPPPPVPATATPPAPKGMNLEFLKLMQDATAAKLDFAQCDTAAIAVGVTEGFKGVQSRPELIPAIRTALGL